VLGFFKRGSRTTQVEDPLQPVAAAIAVGLHLYGLRAASLGEVAAAIATALFVERNESPALGAGAQEPLFSAWRFAGRMQQMASRVQRQDRPPSSRA
jgi:hypothetical protein